METLHIKIVVPPDRKLTLDHLPFQPGEEVEVEVHPVTPPVPDPTYPLRGSVIEYLDPTEPVAVDDWEALK